MFNDYHDILTVDELCELLSIGKNTAYTLLASGQIKAVRLNRVWKIPKIAVADYIFTNSGISRR
ncbi:helix-turn-helix domain-containing protein [Sporomusa aerivorans]|uniref:helix-turn-helix domain-containing protein n=1 Tax=Sporomusa aerivorans TaxID=204936 RepID=UPI00352A43F1